EDLNNGHAKLLLDELSHKSLTMVERRKMHIPLKAGKKIACVAIGDVKGNAFQEAMNRYGKYDFFGIQRDAPSIEFSQLLNYLKQEDYDVVVVSLHNTNRLKAKMYGLSEQGIQLVKDIDKFTDVILVSFGIPYNLQYF